VAVNDLGSIEDNAHLFKYDSVHGAFPGTVEVVKDGLKINGHFIKVLANPDPATLPWRDLGIDVAMECSGYFTKREEAAKHLVAGAKKVLISAPAEGADLTVVYGVNDKELKRITRLYRMPLYDKLFAPVAYALNRLLGLPMVYDNHPFLHRDQRLVDTSLQGFAGACAAPLLFQRPQAAKAVGLVLLS
jgi:glyceraldehyde 3-phosphate dehydrogenase